MARHSRRQFLHGSLALAGIGLLAGCGIPSPPSSGPAKVPRIGYVGATARGGHNAGAFEDGLRELAYVEGQNLTVEWRSTGGRRERVLEVLAELVALKVGRDRGDWRDRRAGGSERNERDSHRHRHDF